MRKLEVQRAKRKESRKRQKEHQTNQTTPEKQVTTDDKREIDSTLILKEDDELINEESFDEFSKYFKLEETPKVLLTTNERPHGKTFDLIRELKDVFPQCFYYPR